MANVDIKVWKSSMEIGLDDRERLIEQFESIAGDIWETGPGMYKKRELFYFNEATGVALATDRDRLVAYSIYKRVSALGKAAIHSVSTTVRPQYQSGGLRSRFIKDIVRAECPRNVSSLFLSTRTRNPINWHVFSRLCDPIVPDYRDQSATPHTELIDIGEAVAKDVFPTFELEKPTMIMRNAFDWLTFFEQPLHKDPNINREFFKGLSETDGIFAIGRARADLLAT